MNFSQNKLVVLARPNEAKRRGRPRKWRDDAARKRAARAEQKEAARQQELLDPAYWERILKEHNLGMDRGKNIPDECGKDAILLVTGGYGLNELANVDAAKQRAGKDTAAVDGGGKGRKTPVPVNPDSYEYKYEPEIAEPPVYYTFDPKNRK